MAKKGVEHISPAKLRAIWGQIDIHDWLTLLNELKPDNKWTIKGNSISGLCFIHPDRDPSFSINLDKGYATCYGNDCGAYFWDPVQFYATLANEPRSTALHKLKKRFNIKIPNAVLDSIQRVDEHNQMKMVLYRALNDELVDALHNSDKPEYAYAVAAGFFQWLRERQFPETAAHMWPCGLLPPRDRLCARIDAAGEDAQKYRDRALDYVGKYMALPGSPPNQEGSIVYVFFTTRDTIGRLRLRKPGTKDFIAVEDPLDDTVGVFGLNAITAKPADQKPVYVVEGEMDALSLLAHQLAAGVDDVPIIATGGKMVADLSSLVEFGYEAIYLIPDNDEAGAGWARTLVSKNANVHRVIRWRPEDRDRHVKDIDEAIRAYSFESCFTWLTSDTAFLRPHEWSVDLLAHELEHVDKEDIRQRTEKAAAYGASLKDTAERNKFVEDVCTTFGLDREALLQNMIPDDDSPLAFTMRLANKLSSDVYDVISEKSFNGTTSLLVWSRRKKVMREIPLNSVSSMRGVLEADLGMLDVFIQQELGEPPFLSYKLDAKGNPRAIPFNVKRQFIMDHFAHAMSALAGRSKPHDFLRELGQGVHFVENEQGHQEVLIVNGARFYQGQVEGDRVRYRELVSPLVGKYYFRLNSTPWSRFIDGVESLDSGMDYDPGKLFSAIRSIIDAGWVFYNQELDVTYLAGLVLYTTVADVFKSMVLTALGGDTHSGKSTLMQIIGGDQYPHLRLCEASTVYADFSAAGLRQERSGSRIPVLLDEFEDNDKGNGKTERKILAVRETLEILRDMREGAKTVRGSSGGKSVQYNLCFPAIIAGIYTMQEPRDVNRYVPITHKKIEAHRESAEKYINDMFTPEQLKDIRRGVTLCFLPRIPQLVSTFKEVTKEFSDNANLPPDLLERLKQNLMPVTAILKACGVKNYAKFLEDIAVAKMNVMRERGGVVRESETIWQHIFHAPVNMAAISKEYTGITTLANIVADRSLWPVLDESDLGVYYLPKQQWLVVFWQRAITGVLKYSTLYRNVQYPQRLKTSADSDPRAISKEDVKNSGILRHELQRRTGTKMSFDDISVFDVRHIIAFEGEEGAAADAEAKKRMMADFPAALVEDLPDKRKGNFEV